MTQPNLSRRQARWMSFLQQYDISIEYQPGKTNHMDALSRRPDLAKLETRSLLIYQARKPPEIQESLSLINSIASSSLPKLFADAYASDPSFNTVTNPDWIKKDSYWISRTSKRIQVPNNQGLRQQLLREFHDNPIHSHPGVKRMATSLKRQYEWPRMKQDIQAYVSSCDTCQKTKASTSVPYGLLQPLPIPTERWADLTMDLITPLPRTARNFSAICVVVDRFTKMTRIFPTTETVTAPQLAHLFLENVFRSHGLPKTIVSDRDPKFNSSFWRSLFKQLQTTLKFSTAYHPQTDGQTERMNRTLITALRAYVNVHQTNWDKYLPFLEFAYNNSVQASTNETPFFLNYGYHPRTPATFDKVANEAANTFLSQLEDALAKAKLSLQQAQDLQTKYANRKRQKLSLQVGDQVLLSTKNISMTTKTTARKLLPLFIGPYTVSRVISETTYKLDLPDMLRIHPVFHVSQLRRYVAPSPSSGHAPILPTPPIQVSGHDEWEVETILQHKKLRGQTHFLVKWKGFPMHESTWEPSNNLKNANSIVRQYFNLLKNRKTPRNA